VWYDLCLRLGPHFLGLSRTICPVRVQECSLPSIWTLANPLSCPFFLLGGCRQKLATLCHNQKEDFYKYFVGNDKNLKLGNYFFIESIEGYLCSVTNLHVAKLPGVERKD
jgi:hypothetical protein